jgi:tetratricopeptide (TPR) repeat protein
MFTRITPNFMLATTSFLLAVLLAPEASFGRFIRPMLEDIPVEKLSENLQAIAKEKPKDAGVRFNLARLHAMAYSIKSDKVQIQKGQEDRGAWFGFTPSAVPFKVQPTDDKDKQKAADEQLAKAIGYYKEALTLDKEHLPSQLGLAWALEQKKEKEAAMKAYREVVEKAWEKDGKAKFGPLGGNFITAEAAGYLMAMLDTDKDKEEITALKDKIAYLKKLPTPITPIAIPLKDNLTAKECLALDAKVSFNLDGTGLDQRWGWLTPNAAWLVYDPRGTGKVTSGREMFGNVTFWLFWQNGYEPLAALDDNRDGTLRENELKGLALWHDANSNGVADGGEVKPLSAWNIVGLGCRATTSNDPNVAAWSANGVLFRDGTTRPSFDVIVPKQR